MCRAGGRRCPGSAGHGRATAAARQRKSRADRAYRDALAAGDTDAADTARARRDHAAAELATYRSHHNTPSTQETTVDQHPESPAHTGDVTPDPTTDSSTDQTAATTTPTTVGASFGPQVSDFDLPGMHVTNIVAGSTSVGVQAGVVLGPTVITTGHGRDVTVTHTPASPVTDEHARRAAEHAAQQVARAKDRIARAKQRSAHARHHTEQTQPDTNGHDTSGHVTNIAGPGEHVRIQAGHVSGGIWINGRRVQ